MTLDMEKARNIAENITGIPDILVRDNELMFKWPPIVKNSDGSYKDSSEARKYFPFFSSHWAQQLDLMSASYAAYLIDCLNDIMCIKSYHEEKYQRKWYGVLTLDTAQKERRF